MNGLPPDVVANISSFLKNRDRISLMSSAKSYRTGPAVDEFWLHEYDDYDLEFTKHNSFAEYLKDFRYKRVAQLIQDQPTSMDGSLMIYDVDDIFYRYLKQLGYDVRPTGYIFIFSDYESVSYQISSDLYGNNQVLEMEDMDGIINFIVDHRLIVGFESDLV